MTGRLFNRALSEKQRKRWEQLRARGKRRFVVLHGVLGWGVPVAVVWSIWMQLWDNGFSLDGFLSARFFSQMVVAFMVFPAAGILFGHWMWWFNERRYLRTQRSDEEA
jgi:hypothetical protein